MNFLVWLVIYFIAATFGYLTAFKCLFPKVFGKLYPSLNSTLWFAKVIKPESEIDEVFFKVMGVIFALLTLGGSLFMAELMSLNW